MIECQANWSLFFVARSQRRSNFQSKIIGSCEAILVPLPAKKTYLSHQSRIPNSLIVRHKSQKKQTAKQYGNSNSNNGYLSYISHQPINYNDGKDGNESDKHIVFPLWPMRM